MALYRIPSQCRLRGLPGSPRPLLRRICARSRGTRRVWRAERLEGRQPRSLHARLPGGLAYPGLRGRSPLRMETGALTARPARPPGCRHAAGRLLTRWPDDLRVWASHARVMPAMPAMPGHAAAGYARLCRTRPGVTPWAGLGGVGHLGACLWRAAAWLPRLHCLHQACRFSSDHASIHEPPSPLHGSFSFCFTLLTLFPFFGRLSR